jgi:hypothetical protein
MSCVFKGLLHAVADSMIVVLGLDKRDGDIGLVIKELNPGTPYWFLIDKKTEKALGLKTDQ